MIAESINKAVRGETLSAEEAEGAFTEIMAGEAGEVRTAALLTALHIKGVSISELTGAARAMRGASCKIAAPADAVDIVGTGGDGFGTFNVSTTAAVIAAGAGVVIAKHGNRASTSRSGAADCLAALGYDLAKTAAEVEQSIAKNGIGFCFANLFHPAMKYAAPVRKQLPFRTVFNLLGPLTNPAGVRRHALGVYSPDVVPLYLGVLQASATRHALIFCGPDGLDELGLSGASRVTELFADGTVKEFTFEPQKVFGATYPMESIRGGSSEENAALTMAVLQGKEKGPYRLAACLNASAALVAGDRAKTLEEGLSIAARSIDSGAALEKLKQLVS